MNIVIDGALIKMHTDANPTAIALCKNTKYRLGKMPTNLKLEMTNCGRAMFVKQKDAKLFLWFVFKALTGEIPPDQAIIVPVLARVPAYA